MSLSTGTCAQTILVKHALSRRDAKTCVRMRDQSLNGWQQAAAGISACAKRRPAQCRSWLEAIDLTCNIHLSLVVDSAAMHLSLRHLQTYANCLDDANILAPDRAPAMISKVSQTMSSVKDNCLLLLEIQHSASFHD